MIAQTMIAPQTGITAVRKDIHQGAQPPRKRVDHQQPRKITIMKMLVARLPTTSPVRSRNRFGLVAARWPDSAGVMNTRGRLVPRQPRRRQGANPDYGNGGPTNWVPRRLRKLKMVTRGTKLVSRVQSNTSSKFMFAGVRKCRVKL